MAATVCPHGACHAELDIDPDRMGRPSSCDRCGQPFTPRPAHLWAKLDRRQQRIASGTLMPGRDDPRRDRRWHYHRAEPGQRGSEEDADPMVETSWDRPVASTPATSIVAVLDDVRSQWNVGAIFRTADACGVGELWLTGITPTPPSPRIHKTALGAEDMVPWHYRASITDLLTSLRDRGVELCALELTADAEPLFDARISAHSALVVGNEVSGVSAEALSLCGRRIAIPMAGRKGSLNVAVAFGVAAFHLTRPHLGS